MKIRLSFTCLLSALIFLLVPIAHAGTSSAISQADAMLIATFQSIDSDCIIDGNKSGFVVQFADKDVSDAVYTCLFARNETTDSVWASFKKSMLDFYHDVYMEIIGCGVNRPNFLLVLTDSTDRTFIYLVIYNDKIVYDVLGGT